MSLSLTYAGTVGNCSGMVIVTVCAGRDRGLTERLPYHRMKSISASRAGDGQAFCAGYPYVAPCDRVAWHVHGRPFARGCSVYRPPDPP